MLRRQELVLAKTVTEEGRAIVVALNKMDTVPPDAWQPLLERVRTSLKRQLPQVRTQTCFSEQQLCRHLYNTVCIHLCCVHHRYARPSPGAGATMHRPVSDRGEGRFAAAAICASELEGVEPPCVYGTAQQVAC